MMVGLGGLWRLHWAPIIEDLVYDFLQGIKNMDKIQVKAVVRGQKVKSLVRLFIRCCYYLVKARTLSS
jgi:hypothetical protein